MTTAAIEGYLHFLETRDGEVDIYRETLSERESFYRDIEAKPVHSRHEFDRETFLRNVTRSGIEPTLDARMAWIIATAKANQSERFGVELTKLHGRTNLAGGDRALAEGGAPGPPRARAASRLRSSVSSRRRRGWS